MNTLTGMRANSCALLFGFCLKESVNAHCGIFNRTACSLLAEKTSDVVIRKNFVVRHGIIRPLLPTMYGSALNLICC